MVLLFPQKQKTDCKTKLLLHMHNTNLLSDLLKTGLAGISLISEENWRQFFLQIVLANHKNGKLTDILKCILWNFDKWILFIFAKYMITW